jgi:hypothetical protein
MSKEKVKLHIPNHVVDEDPNLNFTLLWKLYAIGYENVCAYHQAKKGIYKSL